MFWAYKKPWIFKYQRSAPRCPDMRRLALEIWAAAKGCIRPFFMTRCGSSPLRRARSGFQIHRISRGRRGWGNIIPRTCTWARLIEKGTGQAFYFYNVHLDHLSQRSRKNSVVFLTQFIQTRSSPDPYVLTGDFNAREKSTPIQYLKGKIPLKIKTKGSLFNPEPLMDTFRVRYPHDRNVVTYHGFRRFFFRFKLDYIFVRSFISGSKPRKLFNRYGKNATHLTISRCLPILICPSSPLLQNLALLLEKAVNDE